MTQPALTPDRPALIRFAQTQRTDIDPRDLEGALIALEGAGWPWNRILMATITMVCHLEHPRDLRAAVNDPLHLRRKATR